MAAATALAGVVRAESPWGTFRSSTGAVTGRPLTAVNDGGAAVLADADVPGDAVELRFGAGEGASGPVKIGQISLSGKALRFTSEKDVVLVTDGTESMFRLQDGEWTFDGIRFQGVGETPHAPHEGGAIDCRGGELSLLNCSFDGFVARECGGAVYAPELEGDMVVSNCTFTGNVAGPFNGLGGAIYASSAATAQSGAALRVWASRFSGNRAEIGGAISTFHILDDWFECPIGLCVSDGSLFADNQATYQGGAILAEGWLEVSGTNTVFRGNTAVDFGGAVCVNGLQTAQPVRVTVTNGVCFVGNVVRPDGATKREPNPPMGGAVCVMIPESVVEISQAAFSNNVARPARGKAASGGAIFTVDGCTNLVRKTAFVGNDAGSGINKGSWCYGGAMSVTGGRTEIDTCVFDCGESPAANCYGNAIDFFGAEALLKNSTFRRGAVEAVSAYCGSLSVTNCVLVGNALSESRDLYLEGPLDFRMAYSAYGSRYPDRGDPVSDVRIVGDNFNLAGRQASDVYEGATLRLKADGFNPVAGLGLEQEATDFVEVAYGSRDFGYSMGAYETPTVKLVLDIDGERNYDGTASSNGCAWTWTLRMNGVDEAEWADLGVLQDSFALAAWAFGDSNAGEYASTNDPPKDVAASVVPGDERLDWLCRLLDVIYTGRIRPLTDIVVVFGPSEYPWTGFPVAPSNGIDGVVIVVSNRTTGAVLDESEFTVGYADNVDPTRTAQLVVTCTNNYAGTVVSNFYITAAVTETYVDGVLVGAETNGVLSVGDDGEERTVSVGVDVPDGYCLDDQNSVTNSAVYRYGEGGSDWEGIPRPPVTTLVVRYERDENGDTVPDKYQRKILFATINGYWNGETNRLDKMICITLTNATRRTIDGAGRWDENGVCELSAVASRGVEPVPGVGEKPFRGYEAEAKSPGSWFNGGDEAVANPVGSVVSASSFPIYFYSPAHVRSPGRGDAMNLNVQDGFFGTLRISDFAFDGDRSVAGLVSADIVNASGDSVLETPLPLQNAKIQVLGAETLDGEWSESFVATTGAEGEWFVDRIRKARFFRVSLKTEEGVAK